jgi:hemolysin III
VADILGVALIIDPRSSSSPFGIERVKPRLRGWVHEVACFASIPAGVTLIAVAKGMTATLAASVFALSLTLLFATSAMYHRVRWTPHAERFMKHLDHSMIYVLIAGSYTPLLIFSLHGGWRIGFLSAIWIGAAAGIALKVWRLDQMNRLAGGLYMVLGWIGILALPQIVQHLSFAQVSLLIGGGVLYTVGAIILAVNRPNPLPKVFGYHEIWHVLGVIAAVCHYAVILLLVS